MRKSKKKFVLIDGPSPYDTLESWERHLRELRELPANTALKPQMIKEAKEMIAMKKAEVTAENVDPYSPRAQDHRGDKVRHIPPQATGRFVRRDAAGSKGIVTHDVRTAARHERARGAADRVGRRAPASQSDQRRLAAHEVIEDVALVQRLRCG